MQSTVQTETVAQPKILLTTGPLSDAHHSASSIPIRAPLQTTGILDNQYAFEELTPAIGRLYPTLQLKDIIHNDKADELIRDLAILRQIGEITKHLKFRFVAGVQEAIYCMIMMNKGFIAGSVNVDTPDPALNDMPLVTRTRDAQLNTVLSNSFGFGGTNASLVLRRWQGQ